MLQYKQFMYLNNYFQIYFDHCKNFMNKDPMEEIKFEALV
jgi:hypothetical protein